MVFPIRTTTCAASNSVVVLRLLECTKVTTGNKLKAWFNCFLIKELNITFGDITFGDEIKCLCLEGLMNITQRVKRLGGEYIERLEHFFIANEVGADKQKSVLLSVCGAKSYKLMCTLLAPQKPGDKTYAELVTLVKDHYNPVPSEIAQRFKFNNRSQGPDESIAEFVNQLKALTEHCNFENQLNKMLRDRLVCGVKDKTIQLRLIAEPELTFETAFKMACSLEEANKNVKDLQVGATSFQNPPVTVNALPEGKDSRPCWRCGFPRHSPDVCTFKDKECFLCGKVGHTKCKCCAGRKGSNWTRSTQKAKVIE